MNELANTLHLIGRRARIRTGILILAVAAIGLVNATPASAGCETVDHFGGVLEVPTEKDVFPEKVQLGAPLCEAGLQLPPVRRRLRAGRAGRAV